MVDVLADYLVLIGAGLQFLGCFSYDFYFV